MKTIFIRAPFGVIKRFWPFALFLFLTEFSAFIELFTELLQTVTSTVTILFLSWFLAMFASCFILYLFALIMVHFFNVGFAKDKDK